MSKPDKNCELCKGTGYYGDNGPGMKGNREYVPCEKCAPMSKQESIESEFGKEFPFTRIRDMGKHRIVYIIKSWLFKDRGAYRRHADKECRQAKIEAYSKVIKQIKHMKPKNFEVKLELGAVIFMAESEIDKLRESEGGKGD